MRSIVNAPEAEGLNEGVILGLDIGGTKIALLAWDCAPQTVLTQDAVSTPTENGPDVAIERLGEASEHLLTGCARSLGDLRAIGVAVPGLVDAAAGQVLTAGNLDGWVDLPLADRLVARCTVPVATEHDANAVALGERWRGAAQDLASFAFVALGTGVGVGLVLNGQLYRGAHHAAAELGDLVVVDGPSNHRFREPLPMNTPVERCRQVAALGYILGRVILHVALTLGLVHQRVTTRRGLVAVAHRLTPQPQDEIPRASDHDPVGPAPITEEEDSLRRGTHVVQFYEDETDLLETLTRFIGGALVAGEGAVVLATAAHSAALAERLRARGLDIGAAASQGRYIALEAAEVLSQIVSDGQPDAARFGELVGSIVDKAAASALEESSCVAVFGELVALLSADGNHAAAMALEQLWNELLRTRAVTLLCAYPMSAFPQAADSAPFAAICAAHRRSYQARILRHWLPTPNVVASWPACSSRPKRSRAKSMPGNKCRPCCVGAKRS